MTAALCRVLLCLDITASVNTWMWAHLCQRHSAARFEPLVTSPQKWRLSEHRSSAQKGEASYRKHWDGANPCSFHHSEPEHFLSHKSHCRRELYRSPEIEARAECQDPNERKKYKYHVWVFISQFCTITKSNRRAITKSFDGDIKPNWGWFVRRRWLKTNHIHKWLNFLLWGSKWNFQRTALKTVTQIQLHTHLPKQRNKSPSSPVSMFHLPPEDWCSRWGWWRETRDFFRTIRGKTSAYIEDTIKKNNNDATKIFVMIVSKAEKSTAE